MTGSETGRPEEVCGESYAHGWELIDASDVYVTYECWICVCGESYAHGWELIDASDGYVTYECWICGAEVVLEPHPEAVHGS